MAGVISQEVREIARKFADSLDIDLYLYNGPINERGAGDLVRAYKREHKSAILLLTTNGGSANSGFRIARFLQTAYDEFGVSVFSFCKSSGTLIATGAHRLIMSVSGELGPLDVQLSKRDELWEQRSGLMLRSALTSLAERTQNLFMELTTGIKVGTGTVSLKLASDLAVKMTTGLFAPIYEQVTPEGLGQDYQDLMVAFEYGKRLARVGRNISEYAINHLVHEYPSHDFVIDSLEAKTLFNKVEVPSTEMYQLASKLDSLVYSPESSEVTVCHLSKLDDQKNTDEKDKGASNAAAQASDGDRSTGSSNSSAA